MCPALPSVYCVAMVVLVLCLHHLIGQSRQACEPKKCLIEDHVEVVESESSTNTESDWLGVGLFSKAPLLYSICHFANKTHKCIQ